MRLLDPNSRQAYTDVHADYTARSSPVPHTHTTVAAIRKARLRSRIGGFTVAPGGTQPPTALKMRGRNRPNAKTSLRRHTQVTHKSHTTDATCRLHRSAGRTACGSAMCATAAVTDSPSPPHAHSHTTPPRRCTHWTWAYDGTRTAPHGLRKDARSSPIDIISFLRCSGLTTLRIE